ncbi:hypothetical protein GJ744_003233 [Endocarpon pusillum]|uniref:Uncharacterized protein n=1 Tax=Endocarpon pusillum TaxID=364733 RepID=A0A8H7A837_9EURO|nr:hypothetical protein GJ744_003233 [Endocarpon pusillum]
MRPGHHTSTNQTKKGKAKLIDSLSHTPSAVIYSPQHRPAEPITVADHTNPDRSLIPRARRPQFITIIVVIVVVVVVVIIIIIIIITTTVKSQT